MRDIKPSANRIASRSAVMIAAFAGLAGFLPTMASAEENASNPLAAANNVDLRWQYTSASAGNKHDFFIDGAQMLTPKFKLKYELHYNSNDFTGSYKDDFEKLNIKPLLFPYQTKFNDTWAMKATIGVELIVDLGDSSKAIGAGADQIAPLGGFAFSNSQSGLTIITLVQQFLFVNGTDINTTSGRLIAIQPFGEGYWAKADAKFPYDWENKEWPITAELQVGYNFDKTVAAYVDGLVGISNGRPYDVGVGLGLRFKY